MLKFKAFMTSVAQLMLVPAIIFLCVADLSILGIFMSIIFSYLFCGLGFVIISHRYFTHRAFTLSKWKERLFSIFAVLGTWASPAEWVAMHKQHHLYSDTENDVHSSKWLGWKNAFFFFHKYEKIPLKNLTVAKILTEPWQYFLYKWKYLIILFYAISIYAMLGTDYLFYLWIIPTAYSFIGQITAILNHRDGMPVDSVWQDIITFGDGYHSSHHKNPRDYSKGFLLKTVIDFIKD